MLHSLLQRSCLLIGVAPLVAAVLAAGCCRTPEVLDIEEPWVPAGTVELEEPADTLAYLQEALDPQRPLDPATPALAPSVGRDVRLNRIYYLLSAELRDDLPYHEFVRHWPVLETTLRNWVVRHEIQAEEPVEVANGMDARRVYLGRPGTERDQWRPLLFVLEHDPLRFPNEQIALWRLRAPELLETLTSQPE